MRRLFKKSSRFNVFKSFTLKWWQAGCFKWGMLALGIAVGAHWHELFSNYTAILAGLAVVSLAYITAVWWEQ
jgi:putative Mn2+ efflux pump MntP